MSKCPSLAAHITAVAPPYTKRCVSSRAPQFTTNQCSQWRLPSPRITGSISSLFAPDFSNNSTIAKCPLRTDFINAVIPSCMHEIGGIRNVQQASDACVDISTFECKMHPLASAQCPIKTQNRNSHNYSCMQILLIALHHRRLKGFICATFEQQLRNLQMIASGSKH